MMMTKFPTICLTILFCISAGICAAQSKDTTACMKIEQTMQAGKEDTGHRIKETGRTIEEVQEKVVRQKKAMTAYRKALDPKVRTKRVIGWTAAAVLVTALLSAATVIMRKKYGNSTASPVSDQERKKIEEMTALLTGLLSEKDPESGISKENCARLKKMAGDKRSLIRRGAQRQGYLVPAQQRRPQPLQHRQPDTGQARPSGKRHKPQHLYPQPARKLRQGQQMTAGRER